jgi:hypothetical protein
VTKDDFEPALDLDQPVEGEAALELPWNDPGAKSDPEAIITLDPRGSAVAICYEVARLGLDLLGGELRSPLLAVPVLRGVPRIKPGTPLPQRCDARIELDRETMQSRSVGAGGLRLDLPA